jgi:hydroxyethylthiazole kinase-like uncharacterized protein yjeF
LENLALKSLPIADIPSNQAMRSEDHCLLTSAEMRLADHLAVGSAGPACSLMEAAGAAVSTAIGARWPLRPVIVLCGPGNNGGDGFVAARHLLDAGWPVTVALRGSRSELAGDAARAASLWSGAIVPFTAKSLEGAGLVVDAIFGAGLSRSLSGRSHELVDALKNSRLPVCAIDVPSGVDGSTGAILGAAAPAELTVTFFRKKPGHVLYPGRGLCGEVVVADIGIPASVLKSIDPKAWENDPALWLDCFPWPKTESFKYKRGEVLVLGGEAITGASRMTALAASRAGAGMVTLAAPAKVWGVYATSLMDAVVQSFDSLDDFRVMLADDRRNAIAIGPGAGVGAVTRAYVLAALATQRSVVLDADALTSFAEAPEQLFAAIRGPCVLTPHEGEFKRLFHFTGDKLHQARYAAKQCHAVVVLKGPDTVIAAPDGRAIVNANAPPQLATGGSGDVLTGFVAAMLAQGMPAFEGTSAAVWLHGAAATAFGLGLIASDLPDALPQVLQRLSARPNRQ